MGLNSLRQNVRSLNALPSGDPRIKVLLDREKDKAHDALRQSALGALDASWHILLNSVVRPFVPENGKFDPIGRMHRGAMDSTLRTVRVVGTVLKASGKYGEYRMLKAITK